LEFELEARPPDDTGAWHRSLVLLALLIALVVGVQLWGAQIRQKDAGPDSSAKTQALVSGDFYIKLDQIAPSGKTTAAALRNYQKALPWPSAYRRLGIMKESYGKSGLADLSQIDSPRATRTLDKKQIAKLHREKAMWIRIFSVEKLSRDEARKYVERIDKLNLGSLKEIAKAQVYERSGEHQKYKATIAASKAAAKRSIGLYFLLLAVLIVGGVSGLAGAVYFLAVNQPKFAHAPNLPLQSSMLMSAFIVYLGSYIGLSGVAEALSSAAGIASVGKWSGLAYMALLILSAAAAFGMGLLVLVGRARMLGQDWRQIGFRTANAGKDAALGLAGFFSSVPFVFVAAIIAAVLSKTVFRHFQTPEQPLNQIISQGGALEIVLVFLAASVVAPIVEETFFRGALYSAFRTRTGVWPSVLLTSAVFAVIHPLPGGFLPIFTLACVLALLRERSGSLLPGIVCHCVYNTAVLIATSLLM
jgi:membrane protease YdiL (CAAX protease family)